VTAYGEQKARLLADLAQGGAQAFGLAKRTSNLFRDRTPRKPRVDLSHFHRVISVDPSRSYADVEGMTTFVDLADATLANRTMPAVVPQLKTITIGGAEAGVGIEATSFRHGLVHHTILEMEVLSGDGNVVLCTARNEHSDLFFGFPNSYGTLGYALRLRVQTLPVRRYVQVEYRRFSDPIAYFVELAHACDDPTIDFLDGVVFGRNELFLSIGRFVDEAPFSTDYTYERIYYQSIRELATDYLTARDYLWRWDTDWFWCSKNVGAQHPLLRPLFGRSRLNSLTYQKIMRWNTRVGLMRAWNRWRGTHTESVIQDVDIPVERAAEYLAFMHAEVGILPIWICPIRAPDLGSPFPLYPLPPGRIYVNFGFWDVISSRQPHPPGHFNRMVEHKVSELGGIKSLYSDSYFSKDEFWSIYDANAYADLKRKYDPSGALGDLYAKVVERR
jgi:FAD/FMN-containing dehydrogenase